MLGAMWDAIFSYADDLKERKEFEKLEAVKEVERLLIQAFDDTEACKARVKMKPRNALEEVVISIPGIEVFRDPTDKQIFYEMDGRHYDKPVEVLKELVNYRQNGRKQAMSIVKNEAFRYIKNAVKLLRVNTLDEEKSKTVIRKDRPCQIE